MWHFGTLIFQYRTWKINGLFFLDLDSSNWLIRNLYWFLQCIRKLESMINQLKDYPIIPPKNITISLLSLNHVLSLRSYIWWDIIQLFFLKLLQQFPKLNHLHIKGALTVRRNLRRLITALVATNLKQKYIHFWRFYLKGMALLLKQLSSISKSRTDSHKSNNQLQ